VGGGVEGGVTADGKIAGEGCRASALHDGGPVHPHQAGSRDIARGARLERALRREPAGSREDATAGEASVAKHDGPAAQLKIAAAAQVGVARNAQGALLGERATDAQHSRAEDRGAAGKAGVAAGGHLQTAASRGLAANG